MADKWVRKALALLEQAGCMDLVRPEALGLLRPARRASAEAAAAVMACSPPRAKKTALQVRRGGWLREDLGRRLGRRRREEDGAALGRLAGESPACGAIVRQDRSVGRGDGE
ncbi:hypothetical protein NDU88_000190 [Pleurodeles waltl]|uniref:Uncharacterized protein n=1 Tax=Pleurodeles waltl TaxID=8319 RepID=A0AAV7TEY1_PLEWA|nr:hypothetical protein NDU88_000190 [Pleurodeles waltl]